MFSENDIIIIYGGVDEFGFYKVCVVDLGELLCVCVW